MSKDSSFLEHTVASVAPFMFMQRLFDRDKARVVLMRILIVMCAFYIVSIETIANFIEPMNGEEGAFAFLMSRNEFSRDVIWNASVESIDFVDKTEHPILLYYFMTLLGKSLRIMNFYSIDEIALYKSATLLSFLLVLLATSFQFRVVSQFIMGTVFLSTLFLLLFVLSNLDMLQTDTTIGFNLMALAFVCLAIVLSKRAGSFKWKYTWILICGALIGTGKQEWALLFIASTIIAQVYVQYLRENNSSTKGFKSFAVLITLNLGVILGITINILIDHSAYFGGFDVINRTVINRSVAGEVSLSNYLTSFKTKLPISLMLILIAIVYLLLISKLIAKENFQTRYISTLPAIFVLVSSVVLLTASSFWNEEVRYLAPTAGGALVLPLLYITIRNNILAKRINQSRAVSVKAKKASQFVALLILVYKLLTSIQMMDGLGAVQAEQKLAHATVDERCIYVVDPSMAYNAMGKINWINSWLGTDGVLAYYKINIVSKLGDDFEFCSFP